jgi:sulfoquinovosyltransferase
MQKCNCAKVINVLGFKLPFYSSPTLLLSTALSLRVLCCLWRLRPDVIHVSTPGIMVGVSAAQLPEMPPDVVASGPQVFAATMYAKLLHVPLVMSYHTHIPDYIPK